MKEANEHIMNRTNSGILKFGLLILAGLFLTGCKAGTINTALILSEDILIEEDSQVSDRITGYFEREEYSEEERDEMFYIVENHSEETIQISEFYFVQKLEEDEWITVDNNTINQIDNVVSIAPKESAEFVFWLSFEANDFEPGTYRLYTRMNFLENTNETDEDDSNSLESVRDIYIPFEIL